MSIPGSLSHPDPSGTLTAIDRYRDLAKYLITIFAAVGGVLVAGTQLSAIGSLAWEEDPVRLLVAAGGFAMAMAAVVWMVSMTVRVLEPIELSMGEIADDLELSAHIAERGQLGGLDSVAELRDLLAGDLIEAEQRPMWDAVATDVIDRTALYLVRKRFGQAWRAMLRGGLLGTIGILAFVWAANPDVGPGSGASVPPVPAAPAAAPTGLPE